MRSSQHFSGFRGLLWAGIAGLFLAVPLSVHSLSVKQANLVWIGEKITGKHNGTVKLASANLEFKKSKLVNAKIVIDMTSIKNQDVESPEYRAKLENHLKSADFFDVANYSTATFEMSSAKRISKGKYAVKGKLTIRGNTQKIEFVAKIAYSKKKKSFRAQGEMKIDRTKFGVKYNSGDYFKNLGDKLIYNDFIIRFDLTG